MGYTHYIYGANKLSKSQVDDWISVTNNIIEEYNKTCAASDQVVNCGEGGWTPSHDSVVANGLGSNGHETLFISHDMEDFEFCKTARKPYDAVVVASYIYAQENFGLIFESDGDSEDHKTGMNLYRSVISNDSKKYNHAFSIGFEVIGGDKNEECCDAPLDTYEIED